MTLSINGLDVQSMRWLAHWNGVWTAEIDIQGDVLPSGKVAIVSTEGFALAGTVDADHSATFGEKRRARVLGGGGGWSKKVRAQHYHSDIGITLQVLATTTGAEVGEAVTVLLPKVVGLNFDRRADAAALIFEDAGVDWWVGLDGVTRVGLRPPAVPPTSLEILDWNPDAGTMSFTAAVLVEPGTIIVDPRFGKRVVRSVEAIVASGAVTGTLWVGDSAPPTGAASELADGLAALARAAMVGRSGRLYEFRVIGMAGDRVELQAVRPTDGIPDILPASVWAGISGYRATLTEASLVLVGFIGHEPYVAAYEPPQGGGWRPVQLELDAVARLTLGGVAAAVVIGDVATAKPLVRLTPSLAAWISAVTVALNALAPGSAIAPLDMASTKAVAS